MIEHLAYRARCALIILTSAALTYIVLTLVDRLAANWTECRQWTACPANYLPPEMQS